MILDTSAIVAILLDEPGAPALIEKAGRAPTLGLGVPTAAEAAVVLSARLGRDAGPLLSRFILEMSVVLIPFSEAHFGAAVQAWQRFGKGRHPAALNFGDCLTYAVARLSGDPLLCTGGDFDRTDLAIA